MKFSIIIPVYNVEKYLEKCLDSVIKQDYKNYEAIIVCDKCDDKSESIVDKYIKKSKKITKIYAEKTGLSKAKNIGVENSNGDYLMFLDGDDYLKKDCLKRLSKELNEELDILRFQNQDIYEDKIVKYNEKPFNTTDGISAFNAIVKYHYIEPSWCYVYKKEYWDKHNFKFMENCISEDFGLTPLIIAKANKVKSINYIGYNYVQRNNSLMTIKDYNMKLKKAEDMLKQAEFLKTIIDEESIITFINNSLIKYMTTLKYSDYRKYNKYLKKNGYYNHLKITGLTTLKNVVLIKINAYLFYNYIVR